VDTNSAGSLRRIGASFYDLNGFEPESGRSVSQEALHCLGHHQRFRQRFVNSGFADHMVAIDANAAA
jgi:hypothetical protein